jgi:hypothetical protein
VFLSFSALSATFHSDDCLFLPVQSEFCGIAFQALGLVFCVLCLVRFGLPKRTGFQVNFVSASSGFAQR